MSAPPPDLRQLLCALEPVLHEGVYVFASLPHGADLKPLDPIVTVRESEGITVVVKEDVAGTHALPFSSGPRGSPSRSIRISRPWV